MSTSIESVSTEHRIFNPPETLVKQAAISGMPAYHALCAEAEKDYSGFWGRLGRETLAWHKPFTQVLDESKAPFYRWFHDGELNASYNCLDRNLANGNADKDAIVFEADDGKVTESPTAGFISGFAGSPMRFAPKASRKAIALSFTCRCRSKA